MAGVERSDRKMSIGVGGMGPCMKKLRCADAVTKAMIDRGAEDHTSTTEMRHLSSH